MTLNQPIAKLMTTQDNQGLHRAVEVYPHGGQTQFPGGHPTPEQAIQSAKAKASRIDSEVYTCGMDYFMTRGGRC